MKIDFFNLDPINQKIKKDVINKINQLIDTSSFVEGSTVRDFENKFAEYCGTKYCVAVNNGTNALQLAIMVANTKDSKIKNVATPPNSFFATSAAIVHANLNPYFIDVNGNNFNINTKLLHSKIHKCCGVVPVSLYGNPCNISEIQNICKTNNKFLVHDACQAHGSWHLGKKISEYADLTCFSFYPSKNLGTFGEGGAIVTNSFEYYNKLIKLKNQGQESKYYHSMIGYNCRMDEIQAAILLIKLKYLDEWNEERISIAQRYIKNLKNNKKIKLLETNNQDKCVYHLFPIFTKYKDELIKLLQKNKIGYSFHYPTPIYDQPAFDKFKFKKHMFTYTEISKHEQISLPIYVGMKNEEIDYVCEIINNL